MTRKRDYPVMSAVAGTDQRLGSIRLPDELARRFAAGEVKLQMCLADDRLVALILIPRPPMGGRACVREANNDKTKSDKTEGEAAGED